MNDTKEKDDYSWFKPIGNDDPLPRMATKRPKGSPTYSQLTSRFHFQKPKKKKKKKAKQNKKKDNPRKLPSVSTPCVKSLEKKHRYTLFWGGGHMSVFDNTMNGAIKQVNAALKRSEAFHEISCEVNPSYSGGHTQRKLF
jgi:hypothetical protein